ncbi:MAG: hypothetical protein ACXVXE_06625 [Nocardioidaceae bacterium]
MSNTEDNQTHESTHQAGAFDIRTFIALLIGIYGVVLVVMGVVSSNHTRLPTSLNINLVAGVAMLIFAAAFQAWAMWRPVVVPEHVEEGDGGAGEGPAGH